MRALILIATVIVSACAPGSVQPTLNDVKAMGYTCGDKVRDNVPSGLSQWHCTGRVAGSLSVVDVDGDDKGVAGITLAVDTPDPLVARAEFGRLAADIALLRQEPALPDTLGDWSGPQESRNVGSWQVSMLCVATQCIVDVNSADGPLEPLRLP